ncbi:MAG: hypothetical protein WDN24_10605 [Sphingomonas sp.]
MEPLVTVAIAPSTQRLHASAAEGSGEAGEVLADFLNYDLQASLGSTEGLLKMVETAKHDARALEQVGNAYSLTLDAEKATLEDLFSEEEPAPSISIPVVQFQDALVRWAAGIREII